jgi:hypothetical protein
MTPFNDSAKSLRVSVEENEAGPGYTLDH